MAGLAWWLAGRARWGPAPLVMAVLGGAGVMGRLDWPRWNAMVAVGVVVTILAGTGAARLLARPGIAWEWTATGALISAAGVWAGVPETGPALLAGGAVAGLVAATAMTGSRWAPTAGLGLAVVLGWAALTGAAGRPWAAVGGALCAGVAPWFALGPRHFTPWRSRTAGPWLLGAHMVLTALAARWIGVVPDAGWHRVAVLAAGGLAVAATARWRA